ncbi:MAG: N-6 DNA methylase [Cyanobacteria bacterium J06581_3]
MINKASQKFRLGSETLAVVMKMIESFRESISEEAAATLWLTILAWAKLSIGDRSSHSIRHFCKGRHYSSVELLSGLESALKSVEAADNEEGHLLRLDISRYQSVPAEVLQEGIENAVWIVERGELDTFVPPLDIYGSRLLVGTGAVPDEVVSLIAAIANGRSLNEIYCPYDDHARFAIHAASTGVEVYLEGTQPTVIPKLNQILSGFNFDIAFNGVHSFDERTAPVGRQMYDGAIALLPWGRSGKQTSIQPLHSEKFAKKTASTSVHTLVHLLNRLHRLAVVGVYNGFLVGRNAEQELRKRLVDKGLLEAVISMPSALLPYAERPFSVLVLNPQGQQKTVRFIKGDSNQFYERDGRNRTVLKNWQDLLQVYKNGGERSIVQDISTDEISENNYQLEVSGYVLSEALQKAYAYTSLPSKHHTVKRLGECIETIRPHLKIYKDGDSPARELMTAEFPEFGYLKQPERKVSFSDSALGEDQLYRLFIQPHDIVLSIKGLTGRVAIAPPDTPPPGPDGWLANQSCLILRTEQKQIDPVYLFLYLASEAGQALLQQISTGASTALIQLQPLKALPIPIPPRQEMHEISQTFYRQVAIQEEISQRRAEQIQLSKKYWSLER